MRFVVVDDERIQRIKLAGYLRSDGYEVVGEATDGQEGIDLCRKLKPDAVVFDIMMTPMKGDAAARIVLAEKLVPFVFMASSVTMDATSLPLMELGATFISKPYHRDQLLKYIREAIDGRQH